MEEELNRSAGSNAVNTIGDNQIGDSTDRRDMHVQNGSDLMIGGARAQSSDREVGAG